MVERDGDLSGRGIVAVVYDLGKFRFPPVSEIRISTMSIRDLPVRPHAIHFCMNQQKSRMLVSSALNVFGRDYRARSKVHIGTSSQYRGFLLCTVVGLV